MTDPVKSEIFDNFQVDIRRCELIEGPFIGDVFIYFDNTGICFHFLNASKVIRSRNIPSHKFSRTREEVIKKGSSLAKFLMFFIAFNGQNDSRQIAATYTMGQFAEDRRGFQFVYTLLISADKYSFKAKVTSEQAKMIGLALNNPKKFYQTSISKRYFKKPVLFFQPSNKLWMLYWFCCWGFFLSNTDNSDMHNFLSIFLPIFLIGPILFRIFHNKIVKIKLKSFMASKKYLTFSNSFDT